ncbi:flagellar basal-body MS-ring/collar protein FliF [Lachnospiraceae bacterium 48-42]|jgi:flagellar basal-body M-ring protein/flagellar hook-basal body protein (fliF)|nr:flagellar M-ring protein FliF [Dorea sp.]
MKERIDQLKELVEKLNSRTKKIIIIGVAALIVGAVIIALILNNQPYETLFTGLGQEEAQQITQKLQEDGVDFKYDGDSEILVKKDVLDQTKAALVQEGYPKNGFTYDTFKDNAGMMTTDSDKNTYKLYELQDRIGATIRCFEGVKDAKVTIALGEESKYVLSDDEGEGPSASVFVTMEGGGSPTTEQVAGIQRLVAKSVAGMELTEVVVLDGEGNDVSVDADGNSSSVNGSDVEEIARVIERQISNNVVKVLGPIYGRDNVKVSARAKINMENLVRETITYNTPEKIDEEDKTGIVSKEDLYTERAGGGNTAGGVAGTETNADTAEYNTDSNNNNTGASSESVSREYLVNQIKEQGQVSPGALDDLTVSVAINGEGYGSLRESQLLALVGNAAGIAAADQREKITVVSAPFSEGSDDEEETKNGFVRFVESVPLWVFIVAAVLLVLLLALLIFLLIRRRRRAEEEAEELAAAEEAAMEEGAVEGLLGDLDTGEEEVFDLNKELQEIKNDRGMELKRSVREFAEQNPEIAAQLLKNWLNGGGGDGSGE